MDESLSMYLLIDFKLKEWVDHSVFDFVSDFFCCIGFCLWSKKKYDWVFQSFQISRFVFVLYLQYFYPSTACYYFGLDCWLCIQPYSLIDFIELLVTVSIVIKLFVKVANNMFILELQSFHNYFLFYKDVTKITCIMNA